MFDDAEGAQFGELDRSAPDWKVRFVRLLPHSPERVWNALTDPDELAAWFPTTIEGERAVGAALVFSFRTENLPSFEGEVTAYEPPRLLEFFWGPDRIRIELEPMEDGTRLTLTDTFSERGKAARDAAGWHECLDNLEVALDGRVERAAGTWKRVSAAYIERFGPEASTMGPPEGA